MRAKASYGQLNINFTEKEHSYVTEVFKLKICTQLRLFALRHLALAPLAGSVTATNHPAHTSLTTRLQPRFCSQLLQALTTEYFRKYPCNGKEPVLITR